MGRFARLLAGIVLAWGGVLASPAMAQQSDDPDALNARVIKLYGEGKYVEAIPIAKHALAIREKTLGSEHPDVSTALSNLGQLYGALGRYAEAEPLMKRALAIAEKALGAEDPEVGAVLNNLAGLYESQGHYGDAEPLYKRALAIAEKELGSEHPHVGASLNNLAVLYKAQGRYDEAEPLYRRALAIIEKALGPEHPNVGTAHGNLAELYRYQGRYDEAELHLKRAVAIQEKALGSEHASVGKSLSNLASLYDDQGRYAEAEPLMKRALAITEKALGPEHPMVGTSLNNLAGLYTAHARYVEAELLYKRALTITEKALGPEHPDVATSLSNLATLYAGQGRYAEAIPLYKRSLAINHKVLGPDHPAVAVSLNNLALIYRANGHDSEAEELFERSRLITALALGPGSPKLATPLNNQAALYVDQGRFSEAESLYISAIGFLEQAFGSEHPKVALSFNHLAALNFAQGDWKRATTYWRHGTAIIAKRTERGGRVEEQTLTGKSKSEATRSSWAFSGLVKAGHRLVLKAGRPAPKLTDEMFQAAQWARSSEAAASLQQMAARGATEYPKLGALARERQDLVAEWQLKDKLFIAAKSRPADKRDAKVEKRFSDRLSAIDDRIGEINKQLETDFPDYFALLSPRPLSMAEAQSLLRDEEALVFFFDTADRKPTPEETFIWVVTKTDMRWLRSGIGTKALQEHVAALRCGLDDTSWVGDRRARCAALLGLDTNKDRPRPLPFDLTKAHELYQHLLGEAEDLIKDKHLLVVPSGALTALPFQVLVTQAPKGNDLASAAWLVRDHALTVLPSVASLEALRRSHRLAQDRAVVADARAPFIGFGNPMLAGSPSCGKVFVPEKCPDEQLTVAVLPDTFARLGAVLTTVATYFRNGQADVAEVKKLCPLPDTEHELKCVARSLGAPESSIVVGKEMTEAAVKSVPLDRYRVVHFATHGLLAGETAQLAKAHAEPALVFSPPDEATEQDDGLLTASEVAGLQLDADWVVMSACNTAGGAAPGAEALSGLAKAFFYAGARALLVSHWPVNSYAATMLTSRTFAELGKDPSIGRSEAFRRAMLALIDDPIRRWAAHPSVGAPFIVVGEGGVQPTH